LVVAVAVAVVVGLGTVLHDVAVVVVEARRLRSISGV
jgi:hypothetical protein